ncbi:hypothetical protein ZWY2020_048550 [Hordeum vulgare]|nr:hypothetical protein ZWY2020_048550 [Hordeum vulgare]
MRRRVGRLAPFPALTAAEHLLAPRSYQGRCFGGWPPPAKLPESARRRSSVSLNCPRRRPRTPTSQSGHQKAPIGGATWNYKLWGPARLILCPTLMRIHYLIHRERRANIC